MRTSATGTETAISQGHFVLLLAATGMTYLLIVLGGVVCITDASQACPDWPGCYGQAVPPPEIKAVIEYTHRLVAALTTPLIVAAALVGWRQARAIRWVSRPPLVAIVLVLAVVVFGALVVLRGLPRWAAALDLGSALTVLALMVTASVAAAVHRRQPSAPDRLGWRNPLARLSLAALLAVFAVLVSGVLVAAPGSVVRCLGWPRLGTAGTAHLARAVLSLLASLLVLATVVQAWRVRERGSVVRGPAAAMTAVATAVGALLLTETALVSFILPISPQPAAGGVTPASVWLILSAILATALWAGVVALAILAGLADSQ